MGSPTVDAPTALFDALARRRLLVVSGKGGVGRTTVSALLGLSLARRGRRVLVATTGHDDRLAWMLGASELSDTPKVVFPKLSIQRLDPQVCIREYGRLIVKSDTVAGLVLDNAVVRRLFRALPGLDDFAVLGKVWHEAVRARSHDVVIFDGPATGHLRFTLDVPAAILRTVSQGPLIQEAQQMRAALTDPDQVAAVLVGLPETWPLTELAELGVHLKESVGMAIGAVVVNGLWPADLPALAKVEPGDPAAPVLATIGHVGEVGRRHAEARTSWLEGPARRCDPGGALSIPQRFAGIAGLDDLCDLLAELEGAHSEAG